MPARAIVMEIYKESPTYTGTYTGVHWNVHCVHWKNTYLFHSHAMPRASAQSASGCAQTPPPGMRAGLHERRFGKLARAQNMSGHV